MKLHTMDDVEKALEPYYQIAKETTGKGITVERIERFLAHVGNPEKDLKVVHVAGTSGKTSTTYYIAALLHAAGKKVGHTVSPHVSSLTERVQIDGVPLAEHRFCELMSEFLAIAADAPEIPSWFELLIAFSLWVFAKERVDYVVLETGMGGLHDATNACNLPDKVCVITDIGLDHTQWLGTTLPQIANQKAGIIHPGNVVFMYEQELEVMQVVKFKTNQTKNADLYIQHQDLLTKIYAQNFVDALPLYQRRNWLLAYAVYRYLVLRDGLPLIPTPELKLTQGQVPGRMETIYVAGKTILLDGAHNTPKMQAFVDSFRERYGDQKVPVLLALKKDKEEAEIGPIVSQISSEVIITAFRTSQDWPIKSHDPENLAEAIRPYVQNVDITHDSQEGLAHIMATASKLVVVTGSFYLVGEVKTELIKMVGLQQPT